MRVHDVVELATTDAPPLRHSVEDIVAAGRRVRRRRGSVWAGAVAVLGVATVTAALSAPHSGQPAPSRSPAPGASGSPSAAPVRAFPVPTGPFTFTLGGYDVGRFRVQTPTVVTAAYQRAAVYRDGTTARVDDTRVSASVAELVVYRPGAFDSARFTAPAQVTVAGRPALLETFDHGPVLAWQYTTGAWATIESIGGTNVLSTKDLAAIAAGLVPGEQRQARLPLTMTSARDPRSRSHPRIRRTPRPAGQWGAKWCCRLLWLIPVSAVSARDQTDQCSFYWAQRQAAGRLSPTCRLLEAAR